MKFNNSAPRISFGKAQLLIWRVTITPTLFATGPWQYYFIIDYLHFGETQIPFLHGCDVGDSKYQRRSFYRELQSSFTNITIYMYVYFITFYILNILLYFIL